MQHLRVHKAVVAHRDRRRLERRVERRRLDRLVAVRRVVESQLELRERDHAEPQPQLDLDRDVYTRFASKVC